MEAMFGPKEVKQLIDVNEPPFKDEGLADYAQTILNQKPSEAEIAAFNIQEIKYLADLLSDLIDWMGVENDSLYCRLNNSSRGSEKWFETNKNLVRLHHLKSEIVQYWHLVDTIEWQEKRRR